VNGSVSRRNLEQLTAEEAREVVCWWNDRDRIADLLRRCAHSDSCPQCAADIRAFLAEHGIALEG